MHKLEKQGGFVLLDFVDFHKLDLQDESWAPICHRLTWKRDANMEETMLILVRRLPVLTSSIL